MENIYIKSMEWGYAHPKGFTYERLKILLQENLKVKIELEVEHAFLDWLFDSFSIAQFSEDERNYLLEKRPHLRKLKRTEITKYWQLYEKLLASKVILKGQTIKQYLDYLELKESRIQSKMAFRTSIWSIAIATVTLLISIVFNITAPKPPLPPFDVKVISDSILDKIHKDEINELQQEILRLSAVDSIIRD